jgi:hypothetical protein
VCKRKTSTFRSFFETDLDRDAVDHVMKNRNVGRLASDASVIVLKRLSLITCMLVK